MGYATCLDGWSFECDCDILDNVYNQCLPMYDGWVTLMDIYCGLCICCYEGLMFAVQTVMFLYFTLWKKHTLSVSFVIAFGKLRQSLWNYFCNNYEQWYSTEIHFGLRVF